MGMLETVRIAWAAARGTKVKGVNTGPEIGSAARITSGRRASMEYLAALVGAAGYDEYTKMFTSDHDCAAVSSAIKLPLRSAKWSMEAASDDQLDVEIAAFIEDALFENGSYPWSVTLNSILRFLDYGCMPFYKKFDVVDGPNGQGPLRTLTKLAARPPYTVSEWVWDEGGGPVSIKQTINGTPVEIPIEDLVVFTHNQFDSDIRGTSMWRHAYKAWKLKSILENVSVVAAELRGTGFTTITVDSDDKELIAAAQALGATIRSGERNYGLLVPGVTLDIKGVSGSVIDPLPLIQDLRRGIFLSALAEFLTSGGAGSSGSWAMVRDQSSLFLLSLRSIGETICSTMNRFVIRPWVDANWGDRIKPGHYPKLTHSALDTRDVAATMSALASLIPIQAVDVDPELKAWIREMLGGPPAALPDESGLGVPGATGLDSADITSDGPTGIPAGLTPQGGITVGGVTFAQTLESYLPIPSGDTKTEPELPVPAAEAPAPTVPIRDRFLDLAAQLSMPPAVDAGSVIAGE